VSVQQIDSSKPEPIIISHVTKNMWQHYYYYHHHRHHNPYRRRHWWCIFAPGDMSTNSRLKQSIPVGDLRVWVSYWTRNRSESSNVFTAGFFIYSWGILTMTYACCPPTRCSRRMLTEQNRGTRGNPDPHSGLRRPNVFVFITLRTVSLIPCGGTIDPLLSSGEQ
jgi:hypothetical protein